MQLEEVYAVEITKPVAYLDSKEDPLRQCSSAPTQRKISNVTARCLKTELHRGTRHIKDSIAKKAKDGKGRGYMSNSHVTWTKNWWIMNSHSSG